MYTYFSFCVVDKMEHSLVGEGAFLPFPARELSSAMNYQDSTSVGKNDKLALIERGHYYANTLIANNTFCLLF